MTDIPQYRLRHCAPGDEPALSLIGGATFLEAYADRHKSEDILAHFHKNHSAESYAGYMAMPTTRVTIVEHTAGNAPLGYILCGEPDLPGPITPEDYELRRIYMLYRFQGQGIGKALMNAAVEHARELGRKRLVLGVFAENHDALRFYEKSGFTKIGERFFNVGAKVDHDYILARNV